MNWEMVIGLETHVELSTATKIFCGCSVKFGAEPNTQCCPVCVGLPGAMPVLNRRTVELAATAGLALNCDISTESAMDRKHYFYPDLGKAYQISQLDKPLCKNGHLTLANNSKIRINRIHIEEDAGKLIHEGSQIYVDYNRSGVPLIEIVTEPDLHSAEDTVEYLEKLQAILRTAGVSDCRMQEGSMRCDVNLSIRQKGTDTLNTRTEVKNLNSFTAVAAAINYEFKRQSEILESGGTVKQETLSFLPATGETANMRGKENADDYRYFPEPDIPPIILTPEDIERIRIQIPELPELRIKRFISEYAISEADASLLCKYVRVADYFEESAKGLKEPKSASAFILGQLFSRITVETEREAWNAPVSPSALHDLLSAMESGELNRNTAKRIFSQMLDSGKSHKQIMQEDGFLSSPLPSLSELCITAISENPAAVADYKKGKEKALQALIGSVMRATKGRAQAPEVREELLSQLNIM